MKHVHTISFLVKLWRAFDTFGRQIGEGYIDDRGNAQFYGYSDTYTLQGQHIPGHEILEDVNNQVTILQRYIDPRAQR